MAIKGGHIVDSTTLAGLPTKLQNSEIQIADGFHLVALRDEVRAGDAVHQPLVQQCRVAGNVVLVAMNDVAAGDELTTDYALFDAQGTSMDCQCGAPRCRGVVTGEDWRRPELQQRLGPYFSSYLRSRIDV